MCVFTAHLRGLVLLYAFHLYADSFMHSFDDSVPSTFRGDLNEIYLPPSVCAPTNLYCTPPQVAILFGKYTFPAL